MSEKRVPNAGDYVFDSLDEATAAPLDGFSRDLPLIEAYVKGEVCFHVYLAVHGKGNPLRQFCAVLQWPGGQGAKLVGPDIPAHVEAAAVNLAATQVKRAVLVDVVEFVKHPQPGLDPPVSVCETAASPR